MRHPWDGLEEAHQSKSSDQGMEQAPSTLVHGESIGEEEALRLKDLATEVRDQDDLERDINRQVQYAQLI